jgi:PadR family transcriptional regulator, regulatory protein PadR
MAPSAQPPLGEFELVVLLAVLHVIESGELAYGSPVRNEIERRGKRPVTRGAVYVTLDRLEDKGLLVSRLTSGSDVREHKPKRVFNVTAPGLKAVQQSLELVARMQHGLALARVKP